MRCEVKEFQLLLRMIQDALENGVSSHLKTVCIRPDANPVFSLRLPPTRLLTLKFLSRSYRRLNCPEFSSV